PRLQDVAAVHADSPGGAAFFGLAHCTRARTPNARRGAALRRRRPRMARAAPVSGLHIRAAVGDSRSGRNLCGRDRRAFCARRESRPTRARVFARADYGVDEGAHPRRPRRPSAALRSARLLLLARSMRHTTLTSFFLSATLVACGGGTSSNSQAPGP